MKKLINLLFISAFLFINITETTLAGSALSQEDKDIQEIRAIIGNNYFINSYNPNNLDNDIKAKEGEDGIFENSIQMLSKDSTWNKKVFTDFVDYMKNKETKRAAELYSKNWQYMSPFMPTCCAFKSYAGFKGLKNGIITLTIGGNGQTDYNFEYIFYKNNKLYSISLQNPKFYEYWNDNGYSELFYGEKKLATSKKNNSSNTFPQYYSKVMIYLFNNPTKLSIFNKEYNSFIDNMTKIWNSSGNSISLSPGYTTDGKNIFYNGKNILKVDETTFKIVSKTQIESNSSLCNKISKYVDDYGYIAYDKNFCYGVENKGGIDIGIVGKRK